MKNFSQIIADLSKLNTPQYPTYLKNVPTGLYIYIHSILHEMKQAKNTKNIEQLELLLILAEHDGLNKEYSKIFCSLLSEDWHYSHEDIITLLEDIKDPLSIESIFNAISIENDFYEDEPRPITQKCIWALRSINTTSAFEKLKLLSESSINIIKNAALLQLRDMA